MKVGFQNSSPESSVTFGEVVRQIRAVVDQLTKKIELLCHLMKYLLQNILSHNEETNNLMLGSPRAPNARSDYR